MPDPRTESRRGGISPRGLAAAGVVPVMLTLACFLTGFPLGCPDWFVYSYSPLPYLRLSAATWIVLPAGLAAWGVYQAGRDDGRRPAAGLVLIVVACTGSAAWAFVAPPGYLSQHVYNFRSPSADGAFALEAEKIDDLRAYLRGFPQRALTPPEEMRGTRVISNPPATTLLAEACQRLLTDSPALQRLFAQWSADEDLTTRQQALVAEALLFALLLHILWLVAAVPLYAVARLYLPVADSAAYAVCVLICPLTLVLAPGKDPAQLLTVSVPLFFWLWACRDGRAIPAVLAGAAFLCSCLFSLVHIWIAGIVLIACGIGVWAHREGLRRYVRKAVLPASAGALATALVLYAVLGINVAATALSVAKAQASVVRGPDAMPLKCQFLGLPIFLLLVGPAFWVVIPGTLRTAARSDAVRLGRLLMILSAVVMIATVGFTNMETPRLWIPFLPLLLLGGWLSRSQEQTYRRPQVSALAVLVVLQLVASAVQWSMLDMREAEMRLTSPTPRMFD